MVDELEIKKAYSDKLEDLLTREQREVIADPSVRHVNSLDVYSPVLLAAGAKHTPQKALGTNIPSTSDV